MSLGKESELDSSLSTRTSVIDFDGLCEVDVLGLEENDLIHDENVYKKFKQQLERNEGFQKIKVKIQKNPFHRIEQ